MTYEPTELGDVCDFLRGMTYKPADKLDKDQAGTEAVGVVRTANVQQRLEVDDLVLVPRRMLKSEEKLIREGDIIISSANSWNLVGKCCQAEQDLPDLTFGGFVTNMRPNPEKALPRYVYHFFSSPRVQHVVRSFGRQTTSISNLDLNRTKSLKIPLPPLDEQRRIAGILDAADALRRRRRESLALLDTLPGAIFAEMFGDRSDLPTTKIEDVVVNSRTGPFGSQLLKAEFVESGIPVLGIDNVVTNQFIEETPRFITEQKYKALQRYTVMPGDVLITIMGTCGRCAVVPTGIPTMVNTKHLCCLTPKHEDIHSEYLRSAFLFDEDVHRQLEQQTKGSIMAGLNMGIIKALSIKLPPISEQETFAARLRNVDSQIENCKAHSVELEILFASLQSRAFAGEL